jgi:2-aminoadipate transaminase
MEENFPDTVSFTRPLGGMFIWVTLPEGISSMDVFNAALAQNIAVLPGSPFYIDGGGNNTLRINFSNATDEKIRTGIERLAAVIKNQKPK